MTYAPPGRFGNYPTPEPMGLQLTPAVLKRIQSRGGRRVVDVFDHIRYDTGRFKGGAATETSITRLFQVPLGQTAQVLNAMAESYQKSLLDTNMEAAGSLPAGQEMIVSSIQVWCNVGGQTDTTYPTSGAGTELPTSTAAAAKVSGVNLLKAILTQAVISFKVGEKRYEEGPLYQFPCEFGISGFAGAADSSGNESVSNNGFGRARILFEPRHIPELVNFAVDLQFVQALTISRQFTLTVMLHGILLRPVQ
jgi:hypothetical protein